MNANIPLSSQIVAKAAPNLSHLLLDHGVIYWLQSQPENKGRTALMQYANGQATEVLDQSFSVRSRVHEYGGGAYAVSQQSIVFCNEHDQALYLQMPGQTAMPITSLDTGYRYADMQITPDHKRVICVRESHTDNANIAELVCIDLQAPFRVQVLQQGQDFYASPRISADGSKLCWLSWNHPHMPWDQSGLSIANITSDGKLQQVSHLEYPNGSILQPRWGEAGQLYFISDHQGWWNIYCLQDGEVNPITQTPFDHAKPPWILGLSNYALLSKHQLVCSYTDQGAWVLCQIDLANLQQKIITRKFAEIAHIQSTGNLIYFIASTTSSTQSIQCFNPITGDLSQLYATPNHLSGLINHYIQAEPFSFNNANGEIVYALYYPPNTAQTKPALLVMAHGGPTSQFEMALDLKIQYWVSHGFAVCAVNYAGSSGYGREYRNRLKHQWGIADVNDCIAAAEFLIKKGEVDAGKIAIRGNSAGGYTVLRALSNSRFFSAGTSHYGISDLSLLREQTHKFESLYIDWLIGPYATHAAIFRERSPIQQTRQWQTPVLFLQGGKDKIVPPNQATQLYTALKQKNVDAELVVFADEGHGFRQEKNIAMALEHELNFYQRLFCNK
jgi:dipeptidyl aminopeptidase/acylaminoacyl peptidase